MTQIGTYRLLHIYDMLDYYLTIYRFYAKVNNAFLKFWLAQGKH